MIERWLAPNKFSRGEEPMQRVLGIVLHWYGKPGQSAISVFRYFDQCSGPEYGSAHYIVDHEIALHAVPLNEIAYHAGPRSATTPEARERFGDYPNAHLIGIEMAHVDWEGRILPATLASVRMLCAWLCWRFDLNPMSDIIRHYDVTGKNCPRWFVANPDELDVFRDSVKATMIAAAAA